MMKGSTKIVKGRIEEAAGALANKDKLREKGRTDQAVGQAQQAGEKGLRKAQEFARKITDKARVAGQKAVDKARAR